MNKFYDIILKKINSGVIILDEQFLIIYWNEWLEQYTGILKNQILGKNVQEIIPVFKKNYFVQLFQNTLKMGQSMFFSGGLHPVFITPSNVTDDSVVKQNLQIDMVSFQGDINILLQITDTTNQFKRVETLKNEIANRKQMEKLLFNEKEQFKTTLLSVGDAVISTDNQGKVRIINTVAEKLTGWSLEEVVGKPLEVVFNIIDEISREKYENPFNMTLLTEHHSESTHQAILIAKDLSEIPIEDSVAPIRDERGNITGMVLVFRDITDKKQKQDEIKYLSFHDQLTGLYNRRYYEAELMRLDTERNWPLTIVLGDINGLKLINDSFGHAIGDDLIVKASEAIKKACRADDIISRIGGDEFVVLLPKTDAFEAEKIIKRIKELSCNETVGSLNISISCGYGTKTKASHKIKEIFKKAEDEMYHNKLFESSYMRGKTVDTIMKTLYKNINWEEEHSYGVSKLCQGMGEVIGLSEDKINELKTMGLLHDIGKIAIDVTLLNKSAKLTTDEWKEIQRHSEIGFRILSTVNEMPEIAEYLLSHHERWDGKGYPKGLKGKEIALESRIIGIAEAFDAMTSNRCYSPARSEEDAFEELRKNAGTQFDPDLIEPLIKVIGRMKSA